MTTPDETAIRRDDLLSLAGKTAVVTGGASGMGRAASLLFAAHGAIVVIVDRDGHTADATVAEITEAGGSASSRVVDVADQKALDAFLESPGVDVVDVLYNHAGVTGPTGWDFDAESWHACMAVNLWAPMTITQRMLPLLRRSAAASIIYTASTAGLRAVPGLLTYSASKGALVQFVRSAAVALAPEGIRANAICPGATDTPAFRRDLENGIVSATVEQIAAHIPMRRLGTPEDMASVALFLASDASRYVTGLAIPVEGGVTA